MYRNSVQGLSDKPTPPLEQGFWQQTLFLWGVVANSYYERSVAHIVTALNWNDGLWNWVSGTIDWRDVATILNAYGNLVVDGKIQVYEKEQLSKQQLQNIIEKVAKGSGYGEKIVERVLNQLYYYTKDETIKFDGLLRPANFSIYLKNNVIPDHLKGSSKSQNPDDNLWTVLGLPSWFGYALGGVVVVGLGAYSLTQINTTSKILKG